MSYLTLEAPTGRRLSVLPFATLNGIKDYLEWHYPEAPGQAGLRSPIARSSLLTTSTWRRKERQR